MASASPLPMDPIAEAKRQWVAHGWSEAADAMAAYSSVMRAHQLMYSRVDAALKPLGLSYARLELLRLLSFTRDGALPMASASARLFSRFSRPHVMSLGNPAVSAICSQSRAGRPPTGE